MPFFINQDHPVRIAIQTNPHIRAMGHHGLSGQLRLGGPASLIDVVPVGANANLNNGGAQFPQGHRGHVVSRTIGAINHHLQPIQPHLARERRLHPLNIAIPAVINAFGAANLGGISGLNPLGHKCFNLTLNGVRQFEPIGAKELDAIVMGRIVAGRNHHAQIRAHGAGEQAHRRGGHRAEQEHVHTRGGQPRRQRVFKHIARQARVLANDHTVNTLCVAAEILSNGRANAQGHISRHRVDIGGATHAICAKKLCHSVFPVMAACQRAIA